MQEKFTITELKRLSRALEFDLEIRFMDNKKSTSKVPTVFGRNSITGSLEIEEFKNLHQNGIIEINEGDSKISLFTVTEYGKKKFREEVSEIIKYIPFKERDLEYLFKRINFYCELMYYRFGEDNSKHVCSMYVNYHLKRFYTSHTTSDCISVFEKDLKRLKNELIEKYKISD